MCHIINVCSRIAQSPINHRNACHLAEHHRVVTMHYIAPAHIRVSLCRLFKNNIYLGYLADQYYYMYVFVCICVFI